MELTLIAGEFLYKAENQRKVRSPILCKVLHETLFYHFNLMNVFFYRVYEEPRIYKMPWNIEFVKSYTDLLTNSNIIIAKSF